MLYLVAQPLWTDIQKVVKSQITAKLTQNTPWFSISSDVNKEENRHGKSTTRKTDRTSSSSSRTTKRG
jgi:hypothetical protein